MRLTPMRIRLFMSALLLLSLLLCLLLTGCNTVAGIGADLQRAATWTQEKLDNGFDPAQ